MRYLTRTAAKIRKEKKRKKEKRKKKKKKFPRQTRGTAASTRTKVRSDKSHKLNMYFFTPFPKNFSTVTILKPNVFELVQQTESRGPNK